MSLKAAFIIPSWHYWADPLKLQPMWELYYATVLNRSQKDIKVDIIDSKVFWLAENYHQDFAVKNPLKYNFYRTSCGRDNRLKKVWGEYK